MKIGNLCLIVNNNDSINMGLYNNLIYIDEILDKYFYIYYIYII